MGRLAKRLMKIAEEVAADDGGATNGEVPFEEFCDYVKSQKGKMKHYRKNVKVRAWQSDGNEGGVHNELENATYADVPKGDWIVSNIANKGEMQVVKNGKFQERYDIKSFEPLPSEEQHNKTDGYYMASGEYWGCPYDGRWGEKAVIDLRPTWGTTAEITMDHYMGSGKEDFSDCYPIEKNALKKTYVLASIRVRAGYGNAKYEQAQDADEQRGIDVGQIPQKMKKVYAELGSLIEKGDELTVSFKKSSGVFDHLVQKTGLNSLGSWTAMWKKMAPVLVDAHDVAAAISAPDSVDDMVQLQYYVNSAFRRDYQLKDLEGALRNAWKGFRGELPEYGGYKQFIDGIWQVARDFDAVIKLILG